MLSINLIKNALSAKTLMALAFCGALVGCERTHSEEGNEVEAEDMTVYPNVAPAAAQFVAMIRGNVDIDVDWNEIDSVTADSDYAETCDAISVMYDGVVFAIAIDEDAPESFGIDLVITYKDGEEEVITDAIVIDNESELDGAERYTQMCRSCDGQ